MKTPWLHHYPINKGQMLRGEPRPLPFTGCNEPLPHGMSRDHMENLAFHPHLVTTRHSYPSMPRVVSKEADWEGKVFNIFHT